MREPYFPLFCNIVESTLWSQPGDVIKVFFTLCAKADPEGYVSATVDGIRRAADMPLAAVEQHLLTLSSPDPHSKDRERSPSADGRRIEKVVGGWKVLNLPWYRELAKAEAERARKRKWWEQKGSAARRGARRTETETETETETRSDPEPPQMGVQGDGVPSAPPAAAAAPRRELARKFDPSWTPADSKATRKLELQAGKTFRTAVWARFVDWATSTPRKYRDWNGTWRNWLRRELRERDDRVKRGLERAHVPTLAEKNELEDLGG